MQRLVDLVWLKQLAGEGNQGLIELEDSISMRSCLLHLNSIKKENLIISMSHARIS